MRSTPAFRRQQSGVFLLEALISVLIFAIGLIALVGVSAQAINMVGQSKARNDASYLAGELVGELWVSALSPSAFRASTDYTAWENRVKDPANLPGGAAVVTVNGTAVNITITWIDKKNPSAPPHQYQTTATIAKNS